MYLDNLIGSIRSVFINQDAKDDVMTCKLAAIGMAFGSQGDCGWCLWSYGDDCPLGEMLQPRFFDPAHALFKVGDLLLMGSTPSRQGRPDATRADGRKHLAMVARIEKGHVHLRTLIDFGGPNDPDLVQARVLEDLVKGVMGLGR